MRRPVILSRKQKAKAAIGQDMSDAAFDILKERKRQIWSEGWTPAHDDQHTDGSLADAAACYAATTRAFKAEEFAGVDKPYTTYSGLWPQSWDDSWFRPRRNRRKRLVIAAALLLAEIERLDRAEPLPGTLQPESPDA